MLSCILQSSLALVGAAGPALATPSSLEPWMCDPYAFASLRGPLLLCAEDHGLSPMVTGRVFLISTQSGRLEAAYSRSLVARVERKLQRSERALRNRSEPGVSDPALPAPSAELWLEAPRWPWLLALGSLLAATVVGFGYAARRILLSPHPLLRNYSTREDVGLGAWLTQAGSRRFWTTVLRSGVCWSRGGWSKVTSEQPFSGLRRKSPHGTATPPDAGRTAPREWKAG